MFVVAVETLATVISLDMGNCYCDVDCHFFVDCHFNILALSCGELIGSFVVWFQLMFVYLRSILGVYIFAYYVMVNEHYWLFYNSGLFYACLSTHFHHKSRYKFQKYCENISVSDWLQSKSKDYAQTLWLTYFTSEVGSMTIVSMNITAHVCV